MKSRFLFPFWCKFLGLFCIVAHVPVMLFRNYLGFDFRNVPEGPELFNSHHIFFMVTTLLMLIGLVLVAFSKERIEDEHISQLRMDSLQWAIYLNYFILIVSLAFTGKNDIVDILHLNLWVPMLVFIIIFRWKMFRNSRYVKEDAV